MGHDFKVKCGNEAKEAFSNGQESRLQQEKYGAFGVGGFGFTFWSTLRL